MSTVLGEQQDSLNVICFLTSLMHKLCLKLPYFERGRYVADSMFLTLFEITLF